MESNDSQCEGIFLFVHFSSILTCIRFKKQTFQNTVYQIVLATILVISKEHAC